MAKKQTRRTLSVRIESYVRLQQISERLASTPSALVEAYIEALGNREGIAVPDRAALLAQEKQRRETQTAASIRAHFTF